MGAANDAEIVDDLICTAVIQIGRGRAVAHAQKSFDVDYGKPLLVLTQRSAIRTSDFQPIDAERFYSEIGVGARAQSAYVTLHPPKPNFVQDRRTERVHMLDAEVSIGKRRIVEKVGIELDAGELLGRIDEMHGDLVLGAEEVI